MALSGCGSSTESGRVFSSESGHPVSWVNPLFIGRDSFHGTVIKTAQSGPSGASLFLTHCAACHGNDALGKIGPNIRSDSVSLINAAIKGVPLMKGHSILSQANVQDIAAYLAALAGNAEPVKAVINTGRCMECHGPDLNGGIAETSCFSCHNGPDGSLGHPAGWALNKADPVHYHGAYGRTFVSACANCHGVDLSGGIGPRCSSCHDGSSAPLLESFSLN